MHRSTRILLSGVIHLAAVQAADTATFSLGDQTSYLVSASYTSTLSGSAIDIVALEAPAATGVPQYGWDVHLSPDLKGELDSVTGASCTGDDYDGCFQQISSLLTSPENDVQVRQITALAYGVYAVGALLSWTYMYLLRTDSNLVKAGDFHVPASQLSQASSIFASSYSAVALAAGTDTPFATITPNPSTVSAMPSLLITPASVTTQAVDSGTNKQGDIVFTITESQARRWQDIIARANMSSCDLAFEQSRNIDSRDVQNPLISNVLCASEILLVNMLGQGPATGLTYALPSRFNWQDPYTNEAMHLFQGYARQYAAEFGVNVTTADRYGIAAFTVTREVIINGNNLVGDGTTPAPLFVAASDIDLADPAESFCDNTTVRVGFAGCRMQGAIEACTTTYSSVETCLDEEPATAATFTTSKELILTTIIIPWTVSESDPYPAPTASPTAVSTGTTQHVDQGNLDCGRETDSGNAQHFVDLDMMNQAAHFFCEQLWQNLTFFQPGKVPDNQKHLELHYNGYIGDPVYLSLDWIDDPGCPIMNFAVSGSKDTCLDRLGMVINNCDTSSLGNFWWKQGGSFFRDCMSWTIRRDTWTYSGFDLVENTDGWRPNTHTCNNDKDCADTSNVCASQLKRVCKFDAAVTELGWCYCEDT